MDRVTRRSLCYCHYFYRRSLAISVILVLLLSLGWVIQPAHAAKPRNQTAIVLAQELFDKGMAAFDRQDQKAALAAYNELAQRYGGSNSPTLRALVSKGLLNKGNILSEQGNYDKALNTFINIDNRYSQDSADAIREVVASALVSRAEIQYKKGNPRKAIATYERFARRFDRDENGFIQQLIGMTRLRTAEIKNELDSLSSRP